MKRSPLDCQSWVGRGGGGGWGLNSQLRFVSVAGVDTSQTPFLFSTTAVSAANKKQGV